VVELVSDGGVSVSVCMRDKLGWDIYQYAKLNWTAGGLHDGFGRVCDKSDVRAPLSS